MRNIGFKKCFFILMKNRAQKRLNKENTLKYFLKTISLYLKMFASLKSPTKI